jgi:hypothetical protein
VEGEEAERLLQGTGVAAADLHANTEAARLLRSTLKALMAGQAVLDCLVLPLQQSAPPPMNSFGTGDALSAAGREGAARGRFSSSSSPAAASETESTLGASPNPQLQASAQPPRPLLKLVGTVLRMR